MGEAKAKPGKPLAQQAAESDAMLAARDQAQGTPEEVRRAFLAKRHTLPGLELESWNIGIMWILEELAHPLMQRPEQARDPETGAPLSDAAGQPQWQEKPVSAREAARALLAFAESEKAYEALQNGVEYYDTEAFRLVRCLPPATALAASQLIPTIIAEGLATIPGGRDSNPRATAS